MKITWGRFPPHVLALLVFVGLIFVLFVGEQTFKYIIFGTMCGVTLLHFLHFVIETKRYHIFCYAGLVWVFVKSTEGAVVHEQFNRKFSARKSYHFAAKNRTYHLYLYAEAEEQRYREFKRERKLLKSNDFDYNHFFESVKTPTISCRPSLTATKSRLGSNPDLPADFDAPDLDFVMQVDFSELSLFDTNKMLPASGVLSVFFDKSLLDAEPIKSGLAPAETEVNDSCPEPTSSPDLAQELENTTDTPTTPEIKNTKNNEKIAKNSKNALKTYYFDELISTELPEGALAFSVDEDIPYIFEAESIAGQPLPKYLNQPASVIAFGRENLAPAKLLGFAHDIARPSNPTIATAIEPNTVKEEEKDSSPEPASSPALPKGPTDTNPKNYTLLASIDLGEGTTPTHRLFIYIEMNDLVNRDFSKTVYDLQPLK